MQLVEVLRGASEQFPDRVAMIFRDQPLTFAQIESKANRMANRLIELGIQKDDKVGLMMPNLPDFAIAYYGILAAGASVVPLNVMYRPREVAYIMNDSEAKALITIEPFLPVVLEAQASVPSLKQVIAKGQEKIPNVHNLDALLADAPDKRVNVPVDADDTAIICYTSGTTGNPKGAMLSHRNLLANLDQVLACQRTDIRPGDVGLVVLPLFHIYGMNMVLNLGTKLGLSAVVMERFETEKAFELIQKYRVTVFAGAPPMFVAMINHPDIKKYDLSSLRTVSSGAASLPVQVMETFQKLTGVEIMEGYGLTETSPTLASNGAGPVSKPGSVGPAIPGVEVRIVDDQDRDVPIGEPGEIICRGENVMKGYYKRPQESAEALKGGWFHTGDIGKLDEDGYIYIVDRKKEMVNVSGFNVYPREIEEVLYRHPKVMDAAVIGVPDSYQGESVMAVIALKPGETAEEKEFADYCRQNLAAFKAPRYFRFQEALPKLITGKILKRELREDILKNWPK